MTTEKDVSIGICPEPGWVSTLAGHGIKGSDPFPSALEGGLIVCSRDREVRATTTSMTEHNRTALPPSSNQPSEAEYWKLL